MDQLPKDLEDLIHEYVMAIVHPTSTMLSPFDYPNLKIPREHYHDSKEIFGDTPTTCIYPLNSSTVTPYCNYCGNIIELSVAYRGPTCKWSPLNPCNEYHEDIAELVCFENEFP